MSFLTTPAGVRLRYSDLGQGAGTIVLVHGWKGSHRLWDPAAYRLARSFRVISFDNRGMGESDKPPGRYDFSVLAEDLGFVLAALDAREVTLVGWSMGCTISLEYLAGGGGRVARLALMNGPLRLVASPEFPWTMSEEQLRGYLDDLAAGWPDSERTFSLGALRDPGTAFAEFSYAVALQTPLAYAMGIVEAQLAIDHVPLLPSLRLPVLALYGRHDPYYPVELGTYIAEHVADGRSLVFEESAHAPQYEEPERFCEVVAAYARGEL